MLVTPSSRVTWAGCDANYLRCRWNRQAVALTTCKRITSGAGSAWRPLSSRRRRTPRPPVGADESLSPLTAHRRSCGSTPKCFKPFLRSISQPQEPCKLRTIRQGISRNAPSALKVRALPLLEATAARAIGLLAAGTLGPRALRTSREPAHHGLGRAQLIGSLLDPKEFCGSVRMASRRGLATSHSRFLMSANIP